MRVVRRTIATAAAVTCFLFSAPGVCDEPSRPARASSGSDSRTPASGWRHGKNLAYDTGLLDHLCFPRKRLARHGVDLYLSTLSVQQGIVEGGLEQREVFSTSYDVQAYLDTRRLGLWRNGHGLVRVEGKTNDNGVNPFTGAFVPVNVDAATPVPEGTSAELTEWWYAHDFAHETIEVVAGMWNIGRFFDLSPFSAPFPNRFLNSHMFFNSVLIPYAPYNMLGGILFLRPCKQLEISTSISDPNSSAVEIDWFQEGEINLLHEWRLNGRLLGCPNILSAGFAFTTKEQSTIAQPTATSTQTRSYDWALNANFTQWLYQNPRRPQQAIGLFGRMGLTDGRVNTIKQHFSGGVTFDGMIPWRPRDSVGIVGWLNRFSDDLLPTQSKASAGVECYYRFQLTPCVQLSADFQYLVSPGLEKGVDDAVVLGWRALILF